MKTEKLYQVKVWLTGSRKYCYRTLQAGEDGKYYITWYNQLVEVKRERRSQGEEAVRGLLQAESG